MPFAQRGTFGGRVLTEPVSATHFRLDEPLRYIGERDEFVIPAGFLTDYATVPRIAVGFIPRFGVYTPAAILHDWLLEKELPAGRITSVDADGLFLRALRELDVPAYRRALMWTGVRWGALFNKRRRPGWWSTFPRVAGYSLLFLCSVLPPLVMLLHIPALVVHGAIEYAITSLRGERKSTGSLST